MSSTNRKDVRIDNDYYGTPLNVVREFLTEWTSDNLINLKKLRILDPCAGGSEINPMSYPEVLIKDFKVNPENIDTIDLRENSLAELKEDYFGYFPDEKYDLIITNPPFSMAIEFITKALTQVKEGGYVVMLLRLNYLGSKKRKTFYDVNFPESLYVHHKRISFIREGQKSGTDSIEYAHFVWEKGTHNKSAKLFLI